MSVILVALACGLTFGVGLVISGMTQPAKVLGFLDVLGDWDPTLAFVMGGALALAVPGFFYLGRRGRPLLVPSFHWSSRKAINRSLVMGSSLFGIGWGLVGLCPGPAIANLSTGAPRVIGFVLAMAVGMLAVDLWRKRGAQQAGPTEVRADG